MRRPAKDEAEMLKRQTVATGGVGAGLLAAVLTAWGMGVFDREPAPGSVDDVRERLTAVEHTLPHKVDGTEAAEIRVRLDQVEKIVAQTAVNLQQNTIQQTILIEKTERLVQAVEKLAENGGP